MSTRRRRHHYIPQYLLRRFRIDEEGDKARVWSHTKERSFPASTKDVAVAKDFHGGAESDLEDRLGPVEGDQASLLRRIDEDGQSELAQSGRELGLLFLSFDIRTRAFRSGFGSQISGIAEEASQQLTSEHGRAKLADALTLDYLLVQAREVLASQGFNPAQMDAILRQVGQSPLFLEQIRSQVKSDESGALVANAMGQALQRVSDEKVLETTHQNSIEKLLVMDDAARYADVTWHLMTFEDAPLVLGDMPVVAVSRNGQYGSSFKFKKSEMGWSFLPISTSMAVVGAHNGSELPEIDGEALSFASAGLSTFGFFASSDVPRIQELRAVIGSIEAFFDAKPGDIMSQALDDLELGEGGA